MTGQRRLIAALAVTASTLGLAVPAVAPSPAVATHGPFHSDDFFSGVLDPQVWTTVDPLGDASVTMTGAGTTDARLTIGVPGSVEHDPWTTASAPRVVQEVADADLAVDVKFDSVPTVLYQMQGLLFTQDNATFTRFDVHRAADGLRVFASSTVAGVAKTRVNKLTAGVGANVWLRVTRTGDSWNLRWSPDGTNWTNAVTFTQALTVTEAGPFAGNAGAGAAAAYTARADYAFATSAPVTPEDAGGPGPDPDPDPDPPSGEPFASDDFSTSTLGQRWSVVDPVGGAQVTLTGTGTQDARLAIGLPPGTPRDAAGVNQSTRVLQQVADTDMALELKFDSVPTQRYQDQGLLVQQSTSRWLRFSVYSDGSRQYAYASSTTGTTSTQLYRTRLTFGTGVWLRVSRAGDTWTFQTSPNGSTWTTVGATTQALDVTAVGPYAGIASPSPAWTTLVDYAFDANHPVVPEDGGAPPDPSPSGPTIDVWYGDTQRFGADGVTQPAVNLLGNVSDRDGVSSLRYSLNAAAPVTLTVGPDSRRLQYPGDFNADISYASLAPGANTVTLTAVDSTGKASQKTVTVVRDAATPSLPFVTDWTGSQPLADQATVVDGKWTVNDSGVRVAPGATGYDRLIAVGDRSWTDYQVTVPFTVHGIGPGAGSPLSNEAMVGIGLRWPGHQVVDSKQPAWGYKSIGAYAWYRWFEPPRMELLGNGAIVRGRKDAPLQFGVPYVFKARADTVGASTVYSMKMYRQGAPEPAAWDLTYTGSGPASGSVLLIAHHTDVTFGTVTVEPLP